MVCWRETIFEEKWTLLVLEWLVLDGGALCGGRGKSDWGEIGGNRSQAERAGCLARRVQRRKARPGPAGRGKQPIRRSDRDGSPRCASPKQPNYPPPIQPGTAQPYQQLTCAARLALSLVLQNLLFQLAGAGLVLLKPAILELLHRAQKVGHLVRHRYASFGVFPALLLRARARVWSCPAWFLAGVSNRLRPILLVCLFIRRAAGPQT